MVLCSFSGNTALLDWVLIHGTPTSAKILLRRGYLLNYPWVSVPLILEQENLPMLQCMIQSQQSLQPFALTYTKSFSNSLFQHEVQHFLKSPQSLKSLCRMQVRQLHDYDSEFVPKQLVRFLSNFTIVDDILFYLKNVIFLQFWHKTAAQKIFF